MSNLVNLNQYRNKKLHKKLLSDLVRALSQDPEGAMKSLQAQWQTGFPLKTSTYVFDNLHHEALVVVSQRYVDQQLVTSLCDIMEMNGASNEKNNPS